MNIYDRPRVFYDGEMWQVENIDYEYYIMKLKNKSGGLIILKSNKMFDEEEIKIDRPTGIRIDGKMLFEGDIVRLKRWYHGELIHTDCVVLWNGDPYPSFMFHKSMMELGSDSVYLSRLGDYEVIPEIIGNIHENPELIKEDNE